MKTTVFSMLLAFLLTASPACLLAYDPPESSGQVIQDWMTLEQGEQELKKSQTARYSKKAAASAGGLQTTASLPTLTLEPANPNANETTRSVLQLLETLPSRADNRVISGQFLGHPHPGIGTAYEEYVTALQALTGQWVGMVGADYDRLSDGETADLAIVNQLLVTHWNRGGLVTVSWHARNPWTGGGSRDRTVNGNYLDLITPGTAMNGVWMGQLGRIADALEQLKAAGVTVLWRPFHEANGKSFWWAYNRSAQEQQAMWRHMFQYFSETRGLDNLLWVYSSVPAAGRKGVRPVDYGYPGAGYVDVVGLDVYQSDPRVDKDYQKLLSLGKPFGFTEFGPSTSKENSYDYRKLINKIRSRYPQTVFFQAWNSVWSLIKQKNAGPLLEDAWVLNTGEIRS